MQQSLEDLGRDLYTRFAGAGELLRNIAILVRRRSARPPEYDFEGKVLTQLAAAVHLLLHSLLRYNLFQFQVCIVTGANAGVGLATSEALVARGARVILGCRDKARADAAARVYRHKIA